MAKSSKKVSDETAAEVAPAVASDQSTPRDGATKLEKPSRTKRTVQRTANASSPKPADKPPRAARKSSGPRKPRGEKATPKEPFTDDDIRLRAYFISEQRHRDGIPGSSADDWLEARRQLQAEAASGP